MNTCLILFYFILFAKIFLITFYQKNLIEFESKYIDNCNNHQLNKKNTLFSIIAFNVIILAIIAVLTTVHINLERESILFGQNNNKTDLNSTKIDTSFST
jgi:hypothetical protein